MAPIIDCCNGSQLTPDEEVMLTPQQETAGIVPEVPGTSAPPAGRVDLSRYMGRGEKMFRTDAQEYVAELRSNDRV